ncbi:MAG TPA: thioredoxin family protein [Tepidisphaeraceae bacterium]|nr:thioredoxin family protein [Tepidisphaeraceae bacterium]
MTRRLQALLLIFAGLAAVTAFSYVTRPREKVPWRTDFSAALQEAKQTGKPMLLDFSAKWCGPCQDMRRTTWSSAKVASALGDYVPVQIDVDARPDLAHQFNAEAIPHLVVLDSSGNLVKWTEGELPPDEFLQWLGPKPAAAATTQPITAVR